MLCDSSKRKNIRAIYNLYLFRISRTGKHLNRFIPKQTLVYCLPEAIFGQERTPNIEAIICYRVKKPYN